MKITPEEAAAPAQSVSQPGLEDKAYLLRSEVGILAYGSLRLDPGAELTPWIERRVPTTTPFHVEYVRSSPTRSGAPVLVPAPEGCGAQAPADVFVLTQGITVEAARTMLLKRKLDQVEDAFWYAPGAGDMAVTELEDYAGIPIVLYAAGSPNLPEIVSGDMPDAEKGELLARLAVASLTAETYAKGHDGIQYLADALAQGIETPLSEPYKQALLRLAGGAADLADARRRVASRARIEG